MTMTQCCREFKGSTSITSHRGLFTPVEVSPQKVVKTGVALCKELFQARLDRGMHPTPLVLSLENRQESRRGRPVRALLSSLLGEF